MSRFMLFELVFTEGLAGNPAKNCAEWTTDRRPNHGRRYPRDIPENGCSPPHETADAACDAPKKLVSFEFLGKLVLFPFGFMLLQLTEAAQFPFELQLH